MFEKDKRICQEARSPSRTFGRSVKSPTGRLKYLDGINNQRNNLTQTALVAFLFLKITI